ncbi:MAG: hypothetical protein NTX25_10655, partial [Proteobacteria bacterium]|nr:hypothetical protein [Pseudomonadota bacterium]
MAKSLPPVSSDTLLTSRSMYAMWAATVANLAKTPRGLDRPRKELTDVDLAGAVIQDLRKDLVELWEAFTMNRAEVSRYLMDPKKEALVYLLGFHLSNCARTQGVLRRAEQRIGLMTWLRQQPKSLHIEDLGAGTGALSFASLDLLFRDSIKIPCSVELVDKSQAFLDVATHGLQQLNKDMKIVVRRQRLEEYMSRQSRQKEVSSGSEPLVWYQLGYVWNEIAHNPKILQSVLRHLAQGLSQGGRLITVLEPANQDISRTAMQLREELCLMGYKVLYPCPHSDACPMLERSRDWCYSEWQWQMPPLMQKVDKILEIDRQRIGATAFLLASPDVAEALQKFRRTEIKDQAIVVGRPLDAKSARGNFKKFEYLLCGADGLSKQAADMGAERLRGVVWQKLEQVVVSPISKIRPSGTQTIKVIEPNKDMNKNAKAKKSKQASSSKSVGSPAKKKLLDKEKRPKNPKLAKPKQSKPK